MQKITEWFIELWKIFIGTSENDEPLDDIDD